MENISNDAQAALLLTCPFTPETDVQPLDTGEWNRVLVRLRDRGAKPAAMLVGDALGVLGDWDDPLTRDDRMQKLLDRGMALGLALERWQRAGLWILARPEADYPNRLKERLRSRSVPILFGCGNRRLLEAGGIAVVGSRASSAENEAFARSLGDRLARAGRPVMSGGDRGIDQAAMLGALDAGGTVVGVLADNLLKESISQKYRQALHSQNLVLVSPFPPEAAFNTANAMARNKYIYCLADRAVAVYARTTGGTWNGALENLKNSWVPLWVKHTANKAAGNGQQVGRGAAWLPERLLDDDPQAFPDWLSADR